MSKSLKILLIRFSSIGDIVLTSPIIRCIKHQTNAEIHFLTKKSFSSLSVYNSYISKVHFLENKISALKKNKFDYVIDLQNNFKSNLISIQLGSKISRYKKSNFLKLLYIYIGCNLFNKHVVDKYFHAVSILNVNNDFKGLDFFMPDNISIKANTKDPFIAWCIGGSYRNKQLSPNTIIEVCDKINENIFLIGGSKDVDMANKILNLSSKKNIFSFCGTTTLYESAYILSKSRVVLSNDTGMMHIASAFNKSIISFWGCTKPNLGFSPYRVKNSILIISKNSNRPCSKHGRNCKFTKKCIDSITVNEIYSAYNNFTK